MLFLEIHNRAVEELLLVKFENALQGLKHEKFDHTVSDFDGAVYRLHTLPNDRSKIMVSIYLHFSRELQAFGATELLQREYGPHFCVDSEQGFTVSLVYDLNHLSGDSRYFSNLARQASLLKRNCFAAIFERFIEFHSLGEEAVGSKRAVLHYRPDETLYIQAQGDRVTVIFSTVFKEPDDVIIGKVFLQELTEVRRRIDRAPQVLYSQGTPPAELQGTDAAVGDNVAYITFVLFPRHLTPEAAPRTTNLIHMLRNYLHYHIKCSKGYVHRRMRAKTHEFIKILNRAHPQYATLPVVNVGPAPARLSYNTSYSSLYGQDDSVMDTNGICNHDGSKHPDSDFPEPPTEFGFVNGYN
ncbi:Actin- protein 2/3 complex subunit 2 [Clonorchis sinensis]|uniref:Arp2/3 complex 34 kDa subunit n=1 Tax=Clonorchis sinensis TaxID=79923 RepID=A0A8T1LWP3_CLOSI|nr:Actin- protein 2/3 complex subunit 2 [Clonorchis sinensis]